MRRRPPRSPLFPYTTLFRSLDAREDFGRLRLRRGGGEQGDEWHGPAHREALLAQVFGEERSRTAVGELGRGLAAALRSEEHTSELQSLRHLVCRLLLEKKKQ